MKCNKCGRRSERLRRGMCLNCYRINTGFSGGDSSIYKIEKELEKVKQRVLIMEKQLKVIKGERK